MTQDPDRAHLTGSPAKDRELLTVAPRPFPRSAEEDLVEVRIPRATFEKLKQEQLESLRAQILYQLTGKDAAEEPVFRSQDFARLCRQYAEVVDKFVPLSPCPTQR